MIEAVSAQVEHSEPSSSLAFSKVTEEADGCDWDVVVRKVQVLEARPNKALVIALKEGKPFYVVLGEVQVSQSL